MERFWCCFEAWLSMQRCGESGLTPPSDDDPKRYTIVPMDAGGESGHTDAVRQRELLIGMWAGCRIDEAKEHLSNDSIKVTNLKDKKTQLAKVDQLNDEVRAFFKRQGASLVQSMRLEDSLASALGASASPLDVESCSAI